MPFLFHNTLNDLLTSPHRLPFVWLILMSLVTSCSTSILVESTSSRRPYDFEASALHPEVVTYLHSGTLSVYINLDRDELLYTRDGENTPFTSKVLVQINDERWIWTDTLTSETPRWLSNKFDLNNIVTEGSKETGSWLSFEITDQNRNSSIKNAAEISEVLLWNLNENWPLSNSNAATGTPLKIISARPNSWKVSHVVPPNSLPAPPFSRYRNPLDTLTAAPHSIVDEDWITLEGVQKFASTSNDMEFVIYGRHEDFPDAKDVLFLIESTRYIATRSEYSAMQKASHPKEALDDFWLSCGKSPEKSKELIKTYYARVEEANRYFSGLLEGWRTDRGMIHIIHGVPNRVRRDYWNEYWTYGEEGTSNTLTFRFRRRRHELDNNVFKLERNIVFKSTWDRMVTSWRNGRVQRD